MTHDTQAARLADEAKLLADEYANCHYKHMRTVALRTELHATIDALRDLAIPAGEAVAWRVSHPVSGDIFRDTEPDSGVYPPSYTVTPLYASPQPTPEASQDGGGAEQPAGAPFFVHVAGPDDVSKFPTELDALRYANDVNKVYVDQCAKHPNMEDHVLCCATVYPKGMSPNKWLLALAALRSPLPGRESTAQAGAGEAMYLDEERDTDRRMAYNEGYQDGLFAQSKAAAPSVLAMREALQRIADMRDRDGNAIEMHREVCGIARAALASTLPEPRAGEAGDDVLLRFLCDLHANLPEAVRPMGWSDFSDEQAARARKAWARALAASPIATPEPQEGEAAHLQSALDEERRKFQAETLRTSALTTLLGKWVAHHVQQHGPGPWAKGCALCALVGESQALAASPIATPTRPTLTERLQQKCSDWKTYWRAPDAHGVNLSVEQATELLADALGVEVDIATPKPQERKPLTEDVLRDAARYRFIRDADRSDFNGTSFDTIMRYAMEDLDILVDEAIERERAHGIVPQDGDRGEGEGA